MGLDWMEWENGKKTTTNGMVELLLGEVSINCNLANLRKSANNCHFLINIFFLLKPCKKKTPPFKHSFIFHISYRILFAKTQNTFCTHCVVASHIPQEYGLNVASVWWKGAYPNNRTISEDMSQYLLLNGSMHIVL